MAQNRNVLFFSERVGVKVDSGAFDCLPEEMKEAIRQRSNKTEAELQAEANIRLLQDQLKDPRLTPVMKAQVSELLKTLENQQLKTEVAPTIVHKRK